MLHKTQFVATLIYLQFHKYIRSLQLAMIEATKFGDVASAKFFEEICASVTTHDGFKAGWTPLKYAALHCYGTVSRMLVEASGKLGSSLN